MRKTVAWVIFCLAFLLIGLSFYIHLANHTLKWNYWIIYIDFAIPALMAWWAYRLMKYDAVKKKAHK